MRWKARSMNADAFAAFTLDEGGRAASIKMKPISPATDFSYDFQDLDLQRVEQALSGFAGWAGAGGRESRSR
ncbi:MAG: hypothetical protein WKG07_31440 [Hymenobacter sp.]